MDRNELLKDIIKQVISEMGVTADIGAVEKAVADTLNTSDDGEYIDITSKESKAQPGLTDPEDMDALLRMKSKTPARIGVGRAGGRLTTKSLLTLRADHAAAKDAVFMDVDEELLKKLGMFTVQTKCTDKNQFLTRPDLGRTFSEETLAQLRSKCTMNPQVQIYACDGLSSTAIEANLENILPAITDGLRSKGISIGTPFFVKHGRVATEDIIAETLSAEVVCVLIGERPGLATAESMSAYIAYKASPGMPEARRTVVSNIHKDGISAVEAGAYIADLIEKILKVKKSGVELQS